ncbi:MAG: hypothetical protein ACRC9L_02100 [Brevinema sp.]
MTINPSISTDIKLENGEISLGLTDFQLVSGSQCIIQDIITRLSTDIGALFYASSFGESILRFVHAPSSSASELKGAILRALQSESRIIPNSEDIAISISVDNHFLAEISFTLFDNPKPINLTLSLGNDLEIYEV